MSLATLALRLATVKALTGATLAEGRVFDSAIAPLDETAASERSPFIVVYTDEEEAAFAGNEFLEADNDVSLTIHFAVAAQVQTEADGVEIEIPHTDEGLEVTLDLMRYDILAALQCGGGAWGDLWRRLVVKKIHMTQRRGASVAKGLRFAAREMVLRLRLLDDPPPGADAIPFFVDFDALLRRDPDLAGVADLVKARWSAGADGPDWRKTAAMLGVSDAAKAALGAGFGPEIATKMAGA